VLIRLHYACGLLAVTLLLGGCSSNEQLDTMQSQLSDIQKQVLQLQMQSSSKTEMAELQDAVSDHMRNLLKSEADMRVELQELSTLMEQLQARLEDTNYRLAQLSQQIAATNQELKTFRAAGGGIGGTRSEGALAPSDPETLYKTAYNDYLRGSYDLAILGFRQYLDNYPGTDLADNAAYWIGESYYRQGKFQQATQEFDGVLTRYPRSDKTASALLKKGFAHLELGQRERGIVQLQQVIRRFAGSDEANLAQQRLLSLGVDAQG
jgi:tol-pal system protein YbgF